MTFNRLFLAVMAAFSLSPPAGATTLAPNVGALFADQTEDAIYLTRDRNGDGDAADPGETQLFFGDGNASGLSNPTRNVFTLVQDNNGDVFAGDGTTDTVYRLRDLNFDNDAQDANEASVWFSAANAGGLPLLTPNGLAQGSDGAIYVVEADTVGTPSGDFVYRTEDLNDDGDANDAGEASIWLDLNELSATSSPFEIAFAGDDTFIIDSNGAGPNRIYRASDTDGSGAIDVAAGEAEIFIDENNPFGVGLDFAVATDDGSVLTVALLGPVGGQPIYRLTDLDGSGSIDDASEAQEIWNSDLAPAGFPPFVVFSIAAIGDDVFFTSNGGDAGEDNIYRLTDRNGDGDFLDPDETIVWTSRALTGDLPVRPRAVTGYVVAEPPALSIFAFAAAFALLLSFTTSAFANGVHRRKRRRDSETD